MILAKCPRVPYKRASPSLAQTQEESYKIRLKHFRTATTDGTMRFNTLFFLLITSCFCLALANVPYEDCCLMYVKTMNRNTQRHAVKYRWQVTDGGCNIPAVIFTMKRGRVLCTDPKERWVVELMKKIDEKEANNDSKKPPRKHHPRRPYRG